MIQCYVNLLTLVIVLSSAVTFIEAARNTTCSDQFNDLAFADPLSCSSFYVCLRGKAIRRECSNGLYFDQKIQSCNLPGLTKCFNGDRSGGSLKGNTANQTAASNDEESNSRDVEKAKDEVNEVTTCSTTICVTTPGNKVKDAVAKLRRRIQQLGSNSTNSSSPNDPSTVIIREIIFVTEEPPQGLSIFKSTRDCRDLTDGVYLVDPNHCRRYYICTKNRAKRHKCPKKQWFDRESRACRDQDQVLNCPSGRN
ncbi:uncharacterized protein LOC108094710 [Drosophila ficusphila]|uniref:uncharacterized protein LOC108094710 n=1 Tax=Drosophila ficusphila TaxID=30025 RepID=UPI0007E62EE2|nr:uncharacterized protein LOC108094710 [Drosophila ficusphila]